jgi:tetratricopeptide (TPR) repeat protein
MKTDPSKNIAHAQEWSQFWQMITSWFSFFLRNFRKVSPVILSMVIFTLIYLSKCNSDSNLDGIDHFNAGDYEAALKSYSEFLMLYPDDIKTRYNRARCFEALGDDVNAEIDYNEVLEREPYHINALLGLSQIYYRKNDFQTSINLTERVVMIDEQNFLAHYYSGRAYHKVGYWLHALKCYNRVIELNPEYGYAYFHRSSVMISIGLQPMGCNDLQAAVSLNVDGAREALKKYCGD